MGSQKPSISYKKLLNKVGNQHSYSDGFNGFLTKYRLKLIINSLMKLAPIENILEVGCAEGQTTMELSKYCKNLTALEPANVFYNKVASKKLPTNINLQHKMLEEYSTSEYFDVVIISGVLEHVSDVNFFLKKAHSVLKQTGKLLITVPNAHSLHRQIGLKMGLINNLYELGELDKKVGHFRYYCLNTLLEDLNKAKFKEVFTSGIMLKPFPNVKMEELSKEYCDALFELGLTLQESCAEIYMECCKN